MKKGREGIFQRDTRDEKRMRQSPGAVLLFDWVNTTDSKGWGLKLVLKE